MKIVGLITEYNPFHNGHLFHLNKSKAITNSNYVVVVMSGNFVQRGEPAFCDKYLRTKMALINGADLVLELPIYYATSSAEFFALGAVEILEKSGIVDCLCFGSEHNNIEDLHVVANFLNKEDINYKENLNKYLKNGLSFPKAREMALKRNCDLSTLNSGILSNPNNILAIEYLKALAKINSSMEPYTILREKAEYHSNSIEGEIASATAIRKAFLQSEFEIIKQSMPLSNFNLILNEYDLNNTPYLLDNLSQIFHYKIRTTTKDMLSSFLDVTEGLENRIINISGKHLYLSEIVKEIKTKRYTFTKIQRALLHILLHITKEDFYKFQINGVPYIRVLGFKKESSHLLSKLTINSSIPIITNLKNAKKTLSPLAFEMLEKEIQATDIYYLSGKNIYEKNIEYKKEIIIL